METKSQNLPEARATGVHAPPPSRGAPSGRPSSYTLCEVCFERPGQWRPGQSRHLCGFCHEDNPTRCESCNLRPADIVEWGYFICSSCKAGGRYR